MIAPCSLEHAPTMLETDMRLRLAERMSETFLKIKGQIGFCTREHLLEQDFTQDEVNSYWHWAEALAEIELKLSSKQ